MDIDSFVRNRLASGHGDFHAHDFASYKDYEQAIDCLESLERNGRVEILDAVRESQSGARRWTMVLVRLTDDGRKWLEQA